MIVTRNWLDHPDTVIEPFNEEWIALLPLSELQRPYGRGLARMHFQYADLTGPGAGLGYASIGIDLGAPRKIDAISLMGLNPEPSAGGDHNAVVLAWFSASAIGGTELGFWPGTWLAEWAGEIGPQVHLWGAEPVTARYIHLHVTVTRAHGDYCDIRRLVVGEGMRIPAGCDAGWSLGVADSADVETMRYGGVYAAPGVVTRRLKVGYSVRKLGLAMGGNSNDGRNLLSQVIRAGGAGEVVLTPRASDTGPHRLTRTVWGRVASASPFAMRSGDLVDLAEITVDEIACPPLSTEPDGIDE